jgi:hypothetical protein
VYSQHGAQAAWCASSKQHGVLAACVPCTRSVYSQRGTGDMRGDTIRGKGLLLLLLLLFMLLLLRRSGTAGRLLLLLLLLRGKKEARVEQRRQLVCQLASMLSIVLLQPLSASMLSIMLFRARGPFRVIRPPPACPTRLLQPLSARPARPAARVSRSAVRQRRQPLQRRPHGRRPPAIPCEYSTPLHLLNVFAPPPSPAAEYRYRYAIRYIPRHALPPDARQSLSPRCVWGIGRSFRALNRQELSSIKSARASSKRQQTSPHELRAFTPHVSH